MLSQSTSSIAALLTGRGILTCGGSKQVPWAAVAVAVAAEAAVQLNRKPGDTLATGDANCRLLLEQLCRWVAAGNCASDQLSSACKKTVVLERG